MEASHALLQLISTHNYEALFLFILLEEAGSPLPLPGESLIIFAGSRIARHEMSTGLVFLSVMTASAIGCTILYVIARTGGRALVLRLMGHHRNPQRLADLEARVTRIGPWAVLVGRITPAIRVPTGIAAGLFRIPFHYYLPMALTATCLRLGLFLYIGATAQHLRGVLVLTRTAKFFTGAAILALAGLVWLAWRRHARPRLHRSSQPVHL